VNTVAEKITHWDERLHCSGILRATVAVILGLVFFTAIQAGIDALRIDAEPPITVHSVWAEGPAKPGGTFVFVVDRTKNRQCPSKWSIVLINKRGDSYAIRIDKVGSAFRKAKRATLRFHYIVPKHVPTGHYVVRSHGAYTCADGGQHYIEQPDAPLDVVK